MELSKYYQIDDIYREDMNTIEIYGKDITNTYFCIKLKNEYGRINLQYRDSKNKMVIYNRRLARQMIKVGSDMDFFDTYYKYMDLPIYLFVHSYIMNAIGKHNSSR